MIGWVKYSVLNVDDQRAICGELITYRGDTDESWRRAAKFSAGQIVNRCQLADDYARSISVVREFRGVRRLGVRFLLAKLRNLELGRGSKVREYPVERIGSFMQRIDKVDRTDLPCQPVHFFRVIFQKDVQPCCLIQGQAFVGKEPRYLLLSCPASSFFSRSISNHSAMQGLRCAG